MTDLATSLSMTRRSSPFFTQPSRGGEIQDVPHDSNRENLPVMQRNQQSGAIMRIACFV
jgi:hypothetical protein